MRAWVRLTDGRDARSVLAAAVRRRAAADQLGDRADGLGADGAAAGAGAGAAGAGLVPGGGAASEVAGGWLDEDYRIWDSTGRLVAQSRQLARVPASEDWGRLSGRSTSPVR